MIIFLLFLMLSGIILGVHAFEIDPDWLVWILATVTAAITGVLELARSQPAQALEHRVTTLEAQSVPDLANKLAYLEANSLPSSEFNNLKNRIWALEFANKQASSDSSDSNDE